ncbi:M56 family metallopeptidase [Alistipes sp.]|uniref:M56 family metallopeptidase n=1 Tax=Alistipes sp. TaxID=1872444 RepID=UPI0025BE13E5|nr:M56 family metallopeptidase [Alistipes sp.]MCI7140866.1 TonB-dependent receptor plug domain-containing protein [Alistipes sp.]MDY5396046.1 M56 family metallopeptidase [Alistipes sp.]
MQTLLPYLLKTAACLAVFWIFFRVVMSRTTLYRLNRSVLLAGTALAFLLPFCVITRYRAIPVMPEFPQIVSTVSVPATPEPAWSWQAVGAVLFVAGAIATGLHTLWSLGCVARLVTRGRRERLSDGVVLVRTSRAVSPFSWGRYIVLPERFAGADESAILLHEQAHLRLGHTFDLLWMDAVCLLQWFNPAVWLLRRELREVHEYEADAAVLAAGTDARAYQMLLIKEAAGGRWYSVANSFNHSKLKNRITMMLRKRSSRWAGARALLLLPLVGVALGAFAETRYYVGPRGKDTKQLPEIRRSESEIPVDSLSGDPLVLVDGRPVASLDEVAVEQVNSVTVLKDSASMVQYGPKAANGVVLIELKKSSESASSQEDLARSMAELGGWAGKMGVDLAEVALQSVRDQIPEAEYAEAMAEIRAARADLRISLEQVDEPQLQALKELDTVDWQQIRQKLAKAKSYFDSAEWKEAQKKLEAVGDYFDSEEWKEAQRKMEASEEYFKSDEWKEAQRKMENLSKLSDELSGRMDSAVAPSSNSRIIIGNASVDKDTFAGMKIYIDGEEASSEEVDRLEPEKIRSIEVLTGKKAARRYGEQAAEGVVEIRMRK